MESGYRNGLPLHMQYGEKDVRSCVVHLNYEEAQKLSTREIQEIFRHHHILITGCPQDNVKFDEAGLQTLEKRMHSLISVQGGLPSNHYFHLLNCCWQTNQYLWIWEATTASREKSAR